MAKSIMVTEKGVCFLCGKHCYTEEHHVYEGSGRRKLSEKYGLKVYLCPWCHRLAKDSVHQSAEKALTLKAQGQIRAMAVYGWTVDEFRKHFRRSYI